MEFTIKAFGRNWDGYCVIAIGNGESVNDALKDAANLIGSTFRPKQDGRESTIISVTIERPDGSRFNVAPLCARISESAEELEAGAVQS